MEDKKIEVERTESFPEIKALRRRENGLLKINDVFGPEITVRNELFREFLDECKKEKTLQNDDFQKWMDDWIVQRLATKGYSQIHNSDRFCRTADGGWEKEFKVVRL